MTTAAAIPIETFSVVEKLVLMERLWDDLCRNPAQIPSPDWHGDVLAERLNAVCDGTTSFVEWEGAKNRLRERLIHVRST